MATFTPVPAVEGSPVVPENVTDNLSAAKDAVNEIDSEAIKRDTLDSQHLPGLVLDSGHSFHLDWGNPLDALGNPEGPSKNQGRHYYTVDATGHGAYPGFESGVTEALSWFVIGKPVDFDGVTVLQEGQVPNTEVTFDPLELTDVALLVQLDVMLTRARLGYDLVYSDSANNQYWGANRRPVFAIQVRLRSSPAGENWYTIRQSIRFAAHNPVDVSNVASGGGASSGGLFHLFTTDQTQKSPAVNISIATLIRPETLTALVSAQSVYEVTGVRAAVSVKGGSEEPGHPGDRVWLGRFTFSCTAVRSGII